MISASSVYKGNALCCRRPVSLPEPAAHRAQSVTGPVILRWLRGVVEHDQDGFSIIAGNGRTVVALYGGGRALGAAIIRGPEVSSGIEALQTLSPDAPADYFVMTHPLSMPVVWALSGLFARPVTRELVDDPGPRLKSLLGQRLGAAFSGAVVIRATGGVWAVLMLHDGRIVGAYGSDDLALKTAIHDVSALMYLDQVEIVVHPAAEQEGLSDLLNTRSMSKRSGESNSSIAETETAMIILLSRFEHDLTRTESSGGSRAEMLVRSLVDCYARAIQLAGPGAAWLIGEHTDHPLLDANWISAERRLDTAGLLATLEAASIPDAWLAAGDALVLSLERAVEQQLTWLALADEASATALREALADLLLRGRRLLRRWRDERRGPAENSDEAPVKRQLTVSR